MSQEQQTQPAAVEPSSEQVFESLAENIDSLFAPTVETRERNERGEFAAKELPADNDKAPEKKADDKADPKDAEAATDDDDDDYIEMPPETEGAEPTRLKLAEVLAQAQEAKTLKAQLAERAAPRAMAPPEVEQQLRETISVKQQYVKGLQEVQRWLQPQLPDPEMLNPASANYNPDAYYTQYRHAEQVAAMAQKVTAEERRVAAEAAESERVVHEARHAREWQAALQEWPELKEPATRKGVVDYLTKAGYGQQEIDGVSSRDLTLIKKALAHDRMQAAKETAVKVVSAKPKLVRGGARQSSDGRSRASSQSLERLGKTGSLDDAVAALEQLL